MINLDYLDVLYTWKVESEQNLEKLEKTRLDTLPLEESDWLIKIRKLNIQNAESKVNIHKTMIKHYLSYHSN